MIYLKHDFYSNFTGAVKSKDDKAVRDLLIDSLTDLVIKKEKVLKELFKKVGINISQKADYQVVLKTLLDNIGKNKKLAAGIAYLIAYENNIPVKERRSNQDGGSSGGSGGLGGLIGGLSQLGAQALGLIGRKDREETQRIAAEAARVKAQAELEAAKAANRKPRFTPPTSKTPLIIGGIVAVVAIGGLIYYLATKNKTQAAPLSVEA